MKMKATDTKNLELELQFVNAELIKLLCFLFLVFGK